MVRAFAGDSTMTSGFATVRFSAGFPGVFPEGNEDDTLPKLSPSATHDHPLGHGTMARIIGLSTDLNSAQRLPHTGSLMLLHGLVLECDLIKVIKFEHLRIRHSHCCLAGLEPGLVSGEVAWSVDRPSGSSEGDSSPGSFGSCSSLRTLVRLAVERVQCFGQTLRAAPLLTTFRVPTTWRRRDIPTPRPR